MSAYPDDDESDAGVTQYPYPDTLADSGGGGTNGSWFVDAMLTTYGGNISGIDFSREGDSYEIDPAG